MTVADLKTIVLNNSDDSVDATILLGWLNRGYEYLQQFLVLPELETTTTLTFTAGVATLPTDFMHFVELEIDGDYYRHQIDFEQRNQYSEDASPHVFYLWGTQVGVRPAVTGSGTLAYVKQATTLTSDSDTPKVPTVFQPLIAEYAIGLLRNANGNYAKGYAHFTEVDNQIERLQGKLNKRVRRKSTAMTDIRSQYPNYP